MTRTLPEQDAAALLPSAGASRDGERQLHRRRVVAQRFLLVQFEAVPHGWFNLSPVVKVQKDRYGIARKTFDFDSGLPWKTGLLDTAVLSAAWHHRLLIIHRNPTAALTDTAPWNTSE